MKLLALAAKRCKRMLVKKAKADQADEDYTLKKVKACATSKDVFLQGPGLAFDST